ncbi:MAG: Uma2 family endonuclease [Planctomycetota bacterium]
MSASIPDAPKYNVNDYAQWQGDWELWDGIAIAMSPSPFGEHQFVQAGLIRELGNGLRASACQAVVVGELDWIICDDTVVRPDVMVICGGIPERHLQRAPGLVAEVLSPSTRNNDLGFKRRLYASQGVSTYLIVEPDAKSIELLVLQADGQYESMNSRDAIELRPCEDCWIQIKPSDVFAV